MEKSLDEFLAPVTQWTLEYKPSSFSLPTHYVLITDGQVVFAGNSCIHEVLPEWLPEIACGMHIGHLESCNIQMIDVSPWLPDHVDRLPLRQALAISTKQEASVLSCATALRSWNHRYRYCFSCGGSFKMADNECVKVCTSCDNRCYPHVSPCVIMVVRKDKQLLLARHSGLKSGLYSSLAGFIEPGESAEEAVHREVLEETDIRIKNIEYVGSQSWPFPSQLMLGFLCDYESGELQIDKNELEDGGWYEVDSLPEIPASVSISHYLITEAVRRIKAEN